MEKAIFIDRDGVIIENVVTHVRSWDEVEFIPGVIASLAKLAASPYKIIVVTNQSVIGKGIIGVHAAEEINRRIIEVITQGGGRIDRVYMCPHAASDECNCRKPNPGLILQAEDELNLDVKHSYMIGDAVTDLQAGRSAGIQTNFLVKTGRGLDQIQLMDEVLRKECTIIQDLPAAVNEILDGKK